MSRSRRHTPIRGNCADSDAWGKRVARRRLRRRLSVLPADDHTPEPLAREVSDRWCFAKDGKGWFDRRKWPDWMRK